MWKWILTLLGLYDKHKDKLPGEKEQPTTEPAGNDTWRRGEARFAMTTSAEFETRGIRWQKDKNADGHHEYIIARIEGTGFERILLYHCSGPGRMGRIQVRVKHPDDYRENLRAFPVANEVLVAPCAWRLVDDGSRLRLIQRGREIWSCAFEGMQMERLIMEGGYAGRAMKGEWRNVVVK